MRIFGFRPTRGMSISGCVSPLHSDDGRKLLEKHKMIKVVDKLGRLYPKSSVHVLDLTDGKTVYMFVDKFYPIRATLLERMLRHRLTVPPSYCRDVVVAGSVIQTIQAGLRESYECLASAPMLPKLECYSLFHDFLWDRKWLSPMSKAALGTDTPYLLDGYGVLSGFTRFNPIVTSLKSLNQDYSSKNHERKFLRALLLKWRAKLMAIEEAKDLATLPLDELIRNLKFYEMILENDGVTSKTTKEKFKSLALKSKVTREQTSDDSDKGHFIDECLKPKENKAFVRGAWSDSEDGDEPQNDATCLMVVDTQEVQPKPSTSNNNVDLFEL
ncbi:hypothetical protein Tco_0951824 [Tanacetum coccineum]|uniref:Uncharacterized protein n=1 Tax=Tanacetum coccineum TaxID=301880 RepID=A0ABQ5E193_9ASTR